MTRTELEQAFPQAAVFNSPRSGKTFGIPECEVDGVRVHVAFGIDEDEGLQRVVIEPDQKSSVDPSVEAPAPTVARISQILLLGGLKKMYGEPGDVTSEPSYDEPGLVTKEWRWSFAGTSVVLVRETHASSAEKQRDRTYLVYEKRKAPGRPPLTTSRATAAVVRGN